MDLTPYLRTYRARDQALCRKRVEWARGVRERLDGAVRALSEEFGVRRVVLFGSLRTGEIHERSDVDLAVCGLPPERYFEALARLRSLLGRAVHIVPLEDAKESIREVVEKEGEVLYG